jgi:tRNA A64-2'-O-ribosylphosphate transferase
LRTSFFPVICLSASRQVHDGIERRSSGFAYVQGSGDDHELWGMVRCLFPDRASVDAQQGLAPDMFWAHRDDILNASRTDLPQLIASIVASESRAHAQRTATPIAKVHGCVLVCAVSELPPNPKDWEQGIGYIVVGADFAQTLPDTSSMLRIETWEGKKGQMQFLQDVLPRSTSFIESHLRAGHRVCVACDTGTELSVGIALVALQKFFNDEGELTPLDEPTGNGTCMSTRLFTESHFCVLLASKQSIRTRLEWIITSRPEANPSRTTLKRVNEFLLSSSTFRTSSSGPS